MRNNIFLKIIFSTPCILLCLYFIPIIGLILTIIRFILLPFNNKILAIISLILSFVISLPYLIVSCLNINIEFFKVILKYDIYNHILKCSKYLFIVFIIYIIIYALKEIFGRFFGNLVSKFFEKMANQDKEISIMNDMKMQEKRYRAKNNNYVRCKKCGADNIISEKIDTCSYCRSKLVNNKYTKN